MSSEQATLNRALVIGAHSGIAKALISHLLQQTSVQQVIAVSRNPAAATHLDDARISALACDYSDQGITQLADSLRIYAGSFTQVFVCTGILHDTDIQPEKRLEDMTADQMAAVLRINTILPALWLQTLLPVLKHSQRCVFTVFSARVGSISDNRTGGWYSYRASKAALNMVIKTAAVEYARRAPGVKLLAFHPGTVDTELSRPFQKNVAADKLFTPGFVATKLLAITEDLALDGQASYLDWAGQTIQW